MALLHFVVTKIVFPTFAMMKIKFIVNGKTGETWLRKGIDTYLGRINHLVPIQLIEIPELRNTGSLPVADQLEQEAAKVRKLLQPGDVLILLDEHGKTFTSLGFSAFLNQQFLSGKKNLVFVTGGPFGFSDILKKEASHLVSLSSMTFPHQLVRLLFAEQLYRAMTLLKNLPYHHE